MYLVTRLVDGIDVLGNDDGRFGTAGRSVSVPRPVMLRR
jgi:hypothetical protein